MKIKKRWKMASLLRETIDRIEGSYPSTRWKPDKSFLDVSTYRKDGYDKISSISLFLPEQESLTRELEVLDIALAELICGVDDFRINTPNLSLKLDFGIKNILEYRLAKCHHASIKRSEDLELLCKLVGTSPLEIIPRLEEKTKEVSGKITDKSTHPSVWLPAFLTGEDFTISFNVDKEQNMADICATKSAARDKPWITAVDASRLIEGVHGFLFVGDSNKYRSPEWMGRYFYSEYFRHKPMGNPERDIEKPVYISISLSDGKKYVPSIAHDWTETVFDEVYAVVSPRPKIKLDLNLYEEEAKILEKIVSAFE